MTKSDVFMIIAQIYIVGTLIVDKKNGWLVFNSWFWLILSFIAWFGK